MKIKQTVYSILNNLLNILPPHGKFISWRGKVTTIFLKQSGKNLKMSSGVKIYNTDNLIVKNNVYIGLNTYIGGGLVTLEDEVVIGPFCSIVAGNHTKKDDSYRFGPYDSGTISIGRGTWLGSHCVITNNVKIGKGCLIAAGSVVTKDVDDYNVVGGVPAKSIKNKV